MTSSPSLRRSAPALVRLGRFLWPWVRSERRLVAGSMLALFGSVVLRLAEPWPLKLVFDRLLPPSGKHPQWWSPFGNLEQSQLLWLAAGLLVVLTGLRAVLDFAQQVGFAKVANRVLRQVRNHVFLHTQRLSLAFHTKARSGDLIVRVTRDVSMLRDVTSTAALPLLASVMVLAGMAVVMLVIDWRCTLLATAVLPLFWITTVRVGRRMHETARKQRRREGAMAATAAESIAAIQSVQAFGLEETFAQDFGNRNRDSQAEEMKSARLSARLGRTIDLLQAIATALVLWYGANAVMATPPTMTAGDLVMFLTYLRRAFTPAKDFAKYSARLAKAAAAGERVLDLLEHDPEIVDHPDAVTAPRFAGALRFESVAFAYNQGVPVLSDFDLAVPRGSLLALLGPSGTGKSTTARLLLRLCDPDRGRVTVDGCDLREFTLASLRSQIGVVLQDNVMFTGTVRENIACGAIGIGDADIERVARLANAHSFVAALPDGYDTVVGERGATLSHGQRQRLAIARAALRDASLLILDEPTTGLDAENEAQVVDALLRLCRGRTTVLITHDLALAQHADLVAWLEAGQLVECGTPRDLLARQGRFAAVCARAQQRQRQHG